MKNCCVNTLQLQFLLSWQFTSKHSFPLEAPYFPRLTHTEGGAIAGIVASGPDSDQPYAMDFIVSAIHRARHQVRIVNPYFIPSEPLLKALDSTCRLLTPLL